MPSGGQGQEAMSSGCNRSIEGSGGTSLGRKRIDKTPDMMKNWGRGISRLC